MGDVEVTALEVVEDFSATGRCDEGFSSDSKAAGEEPAARRHGLGHLPEWTWSIAPGSTQWAVLIWRQGAAGQEFLTRMNLRPAAYFSEGEAEPVVPGREEPPVSVRRSSPGCSSPRTRERRG